MTGNTSQLEDCLLPLSRRTPPSPRFFRVIGYDQQGKILNDLNKIGALARDGGAYLQNGLANPVEPEIQRFFREVGEQFTLTAALVARHLTVWLGQLRPAQRTTLDAAMTEILDILKRQGANDNICRNAYIKFMCWLRGPLGGILKGLGQDTPPKVLYEGEIGRYELLFLQLLYRSGCDVVYVNYCSEDSYTKAARGGTYGHPIYGEVRTPPAVPPTSKSASASVPKAVVPTPPVPARQPDASSLVPPPWQGVEEVVLVNRWMGGASFWDAVFLPCAQRETGKFCSLFSACFGGNDRAEYRNQLYHLKRTLDASPKKGLLLEGKVPAPTNNEAAPFRSLDKRLPRPLLIRTLAEKIVPSCGKVPVLLAQRAFSLVMEQYAEKDAVRFLNYGVRLACWLKRYVELFFEQYRSEHEPALVY